MKHILPPFVRCFLIAALAASVVGPLAPTGTAIGDSDTDAKLTVMPSTAAPGQEVTVSGSGFTANARVSLRLSGGRGAAVVAGADARDGTPAIPVQSDGTFVHTGPVPFHDTVTATSGSKTWTAAETGGGRAEVSLAFAIVKRQLTLSPNLVSRGRTVEVFGSGWGVKTRGGVSSRVTITLRDDYGRPILNAASGPVPVSSRGEFYGIITVPADIDEPRLMVIATDNNGPAAEGGTGGFSANQTVQEVLRVTPGVVTMTPNAAPAGSVVTVSGTGFPARMPLSRLDFGHVDLLPSPPPQTDASGSFTVMLTVPPTCYGSGWVVAGASAQVSAGVRHSPLGTLCPGAIAIYVTVADVEGVASLRLPEPSISLSTDVARPGDTITISGSFFSAFANVDTINIGMANQTPAPNLLTDGVGNFTANVTVPALNPGAYTITVRTGPAFRRRRRSASWAAPWAAPCRPKPPSRHSPRAAS